MSEVKRMEDECYKIKAVAQGQQGGWTMYEGVVGRNISMANLGPSHKPGLVF